MPHFKLASWDSNLCKSRSLVRSPSLFLRFDLHFHRSAFAHQKSAPNESRRRVRILRSRARATAEQRKTKNRFLFLRFAFGMRQPFDRCECVNHKRAIHQAIEFARIRTPFRQHFCIPSEHSDWIRARKLSCTRFQIKWRTIYAMRWRAVVLSERAGRERGRERDTEREEGVGEGRRVARAVIALSNVRLVITRFRNSVDPNAC